LDIHIFCDFFSAFPGIYYDSFEILKKKKKFEENILSSVKVLYLNAFGGTAGNHDKPLKAQQVLRPGY